MSETSEYQIVAATPPPQTLTLPQAAEVLNRVGHNELTWDIQHTGWVEGGRGEGNLMSPLEALAVAEFYLRHGIDTWPGWEWKG